TVHVASAQLVVDVDGLAGREPDSIETDVAGAWTPSRRDEQLVTGEGPTVAQGERDRSVVPLTRSALDRGTEHDVDAFGGERAPQLLAGERFELRDEARRGVDDRDLPRPEALPRLGELGPDRSTAEHEEPFRHRARARRRAVVPRAHARQTVDRWHRGLRPRREDHRARGLELAHRAVFALHVDTPLTGEATVATHQLAACARQPLDLRVVVPVRSDLVATSERGMYVELAD